MPKVCPVCNTIMSKVTDAYLYEFMCCANCGTRIRHLTNVGHHKPSKEDNKEPYNGLGLA